MVRFVFSSSWIQERTQRTRVSQGTGGLSATDSEIKMQAALNASDRQPVVDPLWRCQGEREGRIEGGRGREGPEGTRHALVRYAEVQALDPRYGSC